MSRKEFSATTKKAALKRAKGHCEGCAQPLRDGHFHFDHDQPDGLSGQPTLENCRVLCLPCHKAKTREDVARMTKADNQRKSHQGLKPPPKAKLPTKQKEPKVGKLLPPRRSLFIEVKPQ
jgi:5-methylcytosine-specific restriction protein A